MTGPPGILISVVFSADSSYNYHTRRKDHYRCGSKKKDFRIFDYAVVFALIFLIILLAVKEILPANISKPAFTARF